jgi:3-phosphoshikimate 1-carboxyvinyltransferase
MVLGMGAQNPVTVDDGSPITTSIPIFEPLMTGLGAKFTRA